MFGLLPFPAKVIYSPLSPDSQPPSVPGSPTRDSSQEEYQNPTPMSRSALTDRTKFMGFTNEEGSESHLPTTVGESAHFPGSNGSESTSTVSRATTEQQEILSNRLRQRRGHKKSRNGCYNCKKRKIKVATCSLPNTTAS